VPGVSVPPRQRNIVFVLVDDLRHDAMGFVRPALETPHIDRLAREGAHFRNAFVTSSLCSPSRATILTGLSMRNHGIVDNNKASEEGFVYFPSYLQEAGYQTGFFGKWHFGAPTTAPRPGFDRWVSFAGQGSYYPTTYLPAGEVAAGRTHRLNVDGEKVQQQGYITDELTDYALDWLSSRRDPGRPFFLYLSHKAVHSMALPAARHEDQYADVLFEIPPSAASTPENDAGKPMWVQNQRNSWHGVEFVYHTDLPINEYMRDYYRTLSAVDDSLGRILGWLDTEGIAGDTTVIFSSDNGYMEGEHGLIDKRNAYEESMRIPLLLWAPGLVGEGTVVESSVTSLDFAPTFLDCAGLAAPEQFEGRSFLSLATGDLSPEAWDEDVIYEYYWEWNFPQTPTTFATRTRDFKYIQYHGVWDTEELYDLASDPGEMRNLIDDERYGDVKVDLRRRMYERLIDKDGRHVIPYNARTNAGIVFRRHGGSPPASFPDAWHRHADSPDLMDGLLPDSSLKLQLKQAGNLPRLWTDGTDRHGPRGGAAPERDP
jgi:arylsulfatase A-like enzyme